MEKNTSAKLPNHEQQKFHGKVLIVDDDDSVRLLFFKKLESYGFETIGASNSKEAYRYLEQHHFDAVILDQYLGDGLGTELMNTIVEKSPFSKIIFLTAHDSVDLATKALLNGASGFLLKSDSIDKNIQKFISFVKPEKIDYLIDPLHPVEIIGKSPAIKNIFRKINKVKVSNSTILITGDSGVGKELFAKTIHQISNRREAPFIAINCAAISEHLLEAELFGSKKGAFTDSRTDRKGYFETCTNGTLLLDEIGEMSPSMQAKLLRVLQEREVTPVGSCYPVKVNTRVIAATNRNLKDEVTNGRFREDLYYRLAVINLNIPPLRERIEDIPLLVENFIKQFNKRFGKAVKNPSNEVYAKIKAYSWPGNVRELYNSIERAVLLADQDHLYIEDLLPPRMISEQSGAPQSETFILDYKEAKSNFEKNYIKNLLQYTNFSVTDAAKISNQYRTNIYRLIEKHKINLKEKGIQQTESSPLQ